MLTPGQLLEVAGIDTKRQETKPPPRFTQAGLIREMERTGIGRPSTYAETVALLFSRDYLGEEKNQVFPDRSGAADRRGSRAGHPVAPA